MSLFASPVEKSKIEAGLQPTGLLAMTYVSTSMEFLESFKETPPKTKGMPTYTTHKTLCDTLKTNITSIETTLGSGNNGYFGLILTTQQYNQVILPINPGTHHNVPPNNTTVQIRDILQ